MKNAPKSSPTAVVDPERCRRIGAFFRTYRLASGLSEEYLAQELELESPGVYRGYESGRLAMPLEDIFALTNLLNIPPEEVMDLVHELNTDGAL